MTSGCSGLGSDYFAILKEYPLKIVNSQTFLRKKSRMIWNRDLSIYKTQHGSKKIFAFGEKLF